MLPLIYIKICNKNVPNRGIAFVFFIFYFLGDFASGFCRRNYWGKLKQDTNGQVSWTNV